MIAISSAFTRTLATQGSGEHSGVGSSSGSSGAQGGSDTYSQSSKQREDGGSASSSSGDTRQQNSSAANKDRNRTSEYSHERDQKTRAGKPIDWR